MRFLTPAGGEFSAVVREMRKPPLPGFAGPTSIEMVTAITHEFGAVARSLSQATAFASHPVTLAEEGGIVCQVWHLANQVAPWYHQVIIFIYKPPAGCQPEPEVVALLDEELAKCEFLMAAAPGLPATQEIPSRQAKPWWKFW